MKELRRLGKRSRNSTAADIRAVVTVIEVGLIERGVQRGKGRRSDGWKYGCGKLMLHAMLKAVEIYSALLHRC